MANKAGRCVVCGDGPTAKSHLFPRALMLDIRGDAKALYEGSRHRPDYTSYQNGPWDDRFLCKVHEDLAGAGDDYAVKFCRSLAAGKHQPFRQNALQIANPEPHSLLKFVYGTVWRHATAPLNAAYNLDLGPYEQILRRALFEAGPLDLPVIASLSNLRMSKGEPVQLGLAPYRQRIGRWNTWHFIVGLLDVQLKVDGRPFPNDWAPYLANGNDPLILHRAEPMDIATVPLLRPITDQIRATALPRSSA